MKEEQEQRPTGYGIVWWITVVMACAAAAYLTIVGEPPA